MASPEPVNVSCIELVKSFYRDLWEDGKFERAPYILHKHFQFRGSLGEEYMGIKDFLLYAEKVRSSLDKYRCEILDAVCDEGAQKVFAKMLFSGVHTGTPLLDRSATDKRIAWHGAALFQVDAGKIISLWVLGDVKELEKNLDQNATRN